MTTIAMAFDGLPPTSNKIYVRGRILTTEARVYQEQFSANGRKYLSIFTQMGGPIDDDTAYAVHLRFFMNLLNESWNDMSVAPSRRAKTRYKKIDLDNRIKLVTDCVRDLVGVDDSHIFAASQEKHHINSGQQERVEILVQTVDPRLFGL
jgi:Holliday junction resolvase RusA-like endonuclease